MVAVTDKSAFLDGGGRLVDDSAVDGGGQLAEIRDLGEQGGLSSANPLRGAGGPGLELCFFSFFEFFWVEVERRE